MFTNNNNEVTEVIIGLKESKTKPKEGKPSKTIYRGGVVNGDKTRVMFVTVGTIEKPTDKQKAKGINSYAIVKIQPNNQQKSRNF